MGNGIGREVVPAAVSAQYDFARLVISRSLRRRSCKSDECEAASESQRGRTDNEILQILALHKAPPVDFSLLIAEYVKQPYIKNRLRRMGITSE